MIAVVEEENGAGGFEVAMTGSFTTDVDFTEVSERDLQEGELRFGVPAALIILVLVFGALVAALLPLALAIVSIVVALGLTALVAQEFELSIFVTNMLTGMGLALGIDYALFVVSRFREERNAGRERTDAIAATGATASRAVLFSGSAFVLAMVGLLLVQNTIMRSLAAGRDPRRDRLRRRCAHAPAGDPQPARRPRQPAPGAVARPPDRQGGGGGEQVLGRDREPGAAPARSSASSPPSPCCSCSRSRCFGMNIGAAGISTLPDDTIVEAGLPGARGLVPGGRRPIPRR